MLLAKPVPRWLILAGKFAGVILFVGMQAALFFAGTWLALGLRTGIWLNEYLLGVPVSIVAVGASRRPLVPRDRTQPAQAR